MSAAHAPPFLVAHGINDTLISIAHADEFVQRLRRRLDPPGPRHSRLPGAQHSFDLFHSPRFDAVIDGIEAFTAVNVRLLNVCDHHQPQSEVHQA